MSAHSRARLLLFSRHGYPVLFPTRATVVISMPNISNISCCWPPCLVLQYIPDVSRSVFGLLTAMQKRTRDGEEGGVEGAGAGSKSKKAKGGGSGPMGATALSASPKVLMCYIRTTSIFRKQLPDTSM